MVEPNLSDVIFTIISQNYAAQARCLFDSLRVHHPNARRIICLVEESVDPIIFPESDVEIILSKDIVGDGFYEMAYRYSLVELNTAVKPFAIRYFCGMKQTKTCTYIDPDCFLFSPMKEIAELFELDNNIILVPHALQPVTDSLFPGDIDFLRTGTFNLGFIAVRVSSETTRFLDWWADKLRETCIFDAPSGLFVDQKWVDLAPCYFQGVTVLRHPGYNVAYWNAFQRNLSPSESGWLISDKPLRFFHFSGLPAEDIRRIARHQRRLSEDNIGPFFSEFKAYSLLLSSYRENDDKNYVYSYSLIWQGNSIESQALRAALRQQHPEVTAKSMDDFSIDSQIRDVLSPEPHLPADEMFPISKMLYQAWRSKPSLGFHLFTGQARAEFLAWTFRGGYEALEIHRSLLPWEELVTPAPNPSGGRLQLTPALWLLWLTDDELRRGNGPMSDKGASGVIIRMMEEIAAGRLHHDFLPHDYLDTPVIGVGDDTVRVLGYVIWALRADLIDAFPVTSREGRLGLLNWLRSPSLLADYPWLSAFPLTPVPVVVGTKK